MKHCWHIEREDRFVGGDIHGSTSYFCCFCGKHSQLKWEYMKDPDHGPRTSFSCRPVTKRQWLGALPDEDCPKRQPSTDLYLDPLIKAARATQFERLDFPLVDDEILAQRISSDIRKEETSRGCYRTLTGKELEKRIRRTLSELREEREKYGKPKQD